ncbi:protein-tyrosine phosphatase [Salsuginibacillus halophilus]|uniref:Protein-tyrosine phosphatase n=2 Tax=Salsuginibacillus halophilus TaxID=517424 RepID=A0A2P8HHT6_9BACI|nr:protein-tyrosine phosphatase [Salsuginibacillus halophilus]
MICTGNTCRSPMAAALLKEKMPELEVRSAGIGAAAGMPPAAEAVDVLQEHGIHLSGASVPVDETVVAWADLILTMTASHQTLLATRYPAAADKAYTLAEFAGAEGDVADPIGGTKEDYRRTAQMLEERLARAAERIGKEM